MKNFFIITLFLFFNSYNAFAKGSMSYQYTQRINKVSNLYLKNNSWQLNLSQKKGYLNYDFKFRYTPGILGELFSPGELYYQNKTSKSTFWFGKKIYNWEESERFWNLGLLNPQVGFNLSDSDREGLMGIGISKKFFNCHVEITASPINIPQLNPTFITKDKQIIGKNEWSITPPKKVIFNSKDTPIDYEVVMPSISKVVSTASAGANLSCGKSNIFSLYGISKAENQIRISANGAFDAAKGKVLVQAKPFITRHSIVGGSFKKVWRNQVARIGYFRVVPVVGSGESFKIEQLKIEPVYMNESYLNASYSLKKNRFSLKASYIHTFEGRSSQEGVFSKKVYWLDAVGLDLKVHLSEKFQGGLNYKYDLIKKDMVSSLNARYQLTNHVSSLIGLQILNAPTDNSFWSNYRSNDSVYSEVTYTF